MRHFTPEKKYTAARVLQDSLIDSTQLLLPFWDDFSFNNSVDEYASDSLWMFGKSVRVNTGMGINPPTLKVATFDGLDSLGLSYNATTPTARGLADKLTSKFINMDTVATSLRTNVFISFYYQYEGNGEAPDIGENDYLSLWLKNDSSEWVQVWSDTLAVHDPTKFYPVKVFINDTCPRCFHPYFQFRFQNNARLSGPFDTWNLDYVYINNGKQQYAPYYGDLPDRAIATPLTSVFGKYHSLPVNHLLVANDTVYTKPTITANNMRSDQVSFAQPVSLVASLTTTSRANHVITQTTSQVDSLSANLIYFNKPSTFTLNAIPSLSSLDPATDSIGLKVFVRLNTKDDSVKTDSPFNSGDYDTVAYKGLNFRYNDTTSTFFKLTNYYAYDDGEAEYAVTLTEAGTSLAYEFDMVTAQADTLTEVDVYFPHVGDESNQTLLFQVWNDLTLSPLSSNTIAVQRTANNTFMKIPIDPAILVQNKFYVGWTQNAQATVGVGYDKNSDSGDKIFVNLDGSWYNNADATINPVVLHGNLMIRPVFGRNTNVLTAVAEQEKSFAYPNPNQGVFNLDGEIYNVKVVDVTGKNVSFVQEDFYRKTQITLNASSGIYIVRYFNGKNWYAQKIMVLPQ